MMGFVQEKELNPQGDVHRSKLRMDADASQLARRKLLHEPDQLASELFEFLDYLECSHVRPFRPFGVVFGAIPGKLRPLFPQNSLEPLPEHLMITGEMRQVLPCRPFAGFRTPLDCSSSDAGKKQWKTIQL